MYSRAYFNAVMMYTALSLIIGIYIICATVFGKNEKLRRAFFVTDLILGATGILLVPVSCLISRLTVAHADAMTSEWAKGVLESYLGETMPVFLIAFAVISLSAVCALLSGKTHGNKKTQSMSIFSAMRRLTSVFASLLMLFLGGLYCALSASDRINIDLYIMLISIGEALAYRSYHALEYFVSHQ